MGTLGTFDAFTAARLGIYAAQLGLKVTGNNVSNINTSGYTRQRIDQVSLRTGGNDRYAPPFAGHIGNGALVRGVNQIRDPYLDIRYRSTNADVGYHDTMLKGLNEIASILDEVGRGGNSAETYGDGLLYAQLQDMAEKLRSFSERPTNDSENLVRKSAAALTTLFNNYANRLEELRQDTETDFKNSVTDINDILINIRDLNKSIRQCELNGDKALELRDERNRQIDALSEYMDIRVIYSEEDIGAGLKVEKLSIHLDNANPDKKIETDSSLLVDGVYATQLSVPEKKPVINPDFDPTKYVKGDADTEKYIYLYRTGEIDNTDPANPIVNYTGYTNDPTEAFLVDNDNYTIQLGKLLDSHEVEWKSSSTEPPVKLADGEGGSVVGKAATYKTTLQLKEDGALPTAIKIGDQDVTIPSTVKDLNGLAKFLAGKLDALNADYAVTSNGADIIFTAYQKGAIGGNGPAAVPALSLENGGDLSLSTANGPLDVVQAGVDSVPPNDPNAGTSIFDPITGEETYYNYSEIGDAWYKITAHIQHTREVALDDNDLHGKLQAQRELLTEEGNFASDNDVLIDENALTKRGIPYYQKSFDLLAQTLAEQYNKLNQGFAVNQNGNYIRADGSEILLAEADGSGPYAIDKY
ncbi:MAG: hypothetical protein K2K53_01965, partial [Oscillospiraceae bacterium]|nr:hypothetical protein [Oscillospiraceae bacterium]